MKRMIIAFYAFLLNRYPTPFRELFADEMLDIFTLAYESKRQERPLARMYFILREFTALPLAIGDEHLQELESKDFVMMLATPQFRRIIRSLSLVYVVLVFLIIFAIPAISGDGLRLLALTSFQMIMLVSILIAWRWQKMGGIVVLTSAALLGLIMFLGLATVPGNLSGALIAAGLWTLPYLAWGILFILSRQRNNDLPQPAA
jgi:hypothetical protein